MTNILSTIFPSSYIIQQLKLTYATVFWFSGSSTPPPVTKSPATTLAYTGETNMNEILIETNKH